jgi:hypothetical protein
MNAAPPTTTTTRNVAALPPLAPLLLCQTIPTDVGVSLPKPKSRTHTSYHSFIALPTCNEVSKVDTEKGLWIYCSVCGRAIACRHSCPFTLAWWVDHKTKDSVHLKKLCHLDSMKAIALKQKQKTLKLTSLEKGQLVQIKKKQSGVKQSFTAKKKPPSPTAVTTVSSSIVTHDSLLNVAHDSDTNVAAPRKKPKVTTCEEIFPGYNIKSNGGMRDTIRVYYSLYGATDSKSLYKVSYVGNLPTLCSVECTQSDGSSQTTKRGSIF